MVLDLRGAQGGMSQTDRSQAQKEVALTAERVVARWLVESGFRLKVLPEHGSCTLSRLLLDRHDMLQIVSYGTAEINKIVNDRRGRGSRIEVTAADQLRNCGLDDA